MATKRILAHFMHESERDAALPLINQPKITESYILGEIDEDKIPNLRQQGLIVQVLNPTEVTTRGGETRSARRGISPGSTTRGAAEPNRPDFYVIQLQGPLLEDWRQRLGSERVALLSYVPDNSYIAR